MFRCPIFCVVFQISSKAFCQKKLFASSLSTPSAVVTVKWVMCQCALSFLALILKNIACKDFTCLATISLHIHKSLAPKMVVCLSPYCMTNNSSLAKDFFLAHILHAKSIPF